MKINAKKIFFKLIVVIIIASGGFYLYKNPSLLTQFKAQTTNKPQIIDQSQNIIILQNQINSLKEQLKNTPDISKKADITQLEKIEETLSQINQRVDNLSKKTNKNALILTSAHMIKAQADQGEPFETQAFLLENLSKNDPVYNSDVQTILSIAKQGVLSKDALIKQFNTIYNMSLAKQKKAFADSQTTSFKSKLDSFIKIKKTSNTKVFKPNQELEEIKALVDSKNLYLAAQKIQKNTNDELQINKKLNPWQDNITRRKTLYDAINNIIAKSIIAIDLQTFDKE